jgi:molybdopterin synthase sulfur carrier subunit
VQVQLRFFALLRDRLGARTARTVATGTTAGALWQDVVAGHPELRRLKVRIAVNQRYVEPSHRLEDDDEVAFFPPVSGGR